jgi:hypothetical protein
MAGFVVAGCLLTLREEINAIAPGRNRASDGTIGDSAHQQRKSDHNPDGNGVVRALDVTHDPAAGADMAAIAEHLRERRDPRTKYVIFNRRIFSPRTKWAWKDFDGQPHDHHLHISVVADGHADDRSGWGLHNGVPVIPEKTKPTTTTTPNTATTTPAEIVPDARGEAVLQLQLLLIRIGLIRDTSGNRDKHYGTETQKVIRRFQTANDLDPDGRVGPKTWAALIALDR